MGFLWRWALAFGLLAATWNPTAYNYIGWVVPNGSANLALAVFLGLVLVALYTVFLTAVLRGIGALGSVLILALVAAAVWVLWDMGWISLENPSLLSWIALLAVSLVLAFGMYWGIFWRRISGQVEVDDESQG